MLGIAGARSRIAEEFDQLLGDVPVIIGRCDDLPVTCSHYLVCTGYLAGKALGEIGISEALTSWRINFLDVAQLCERVFSQNDTARIVVIGSESGIRGSYDFAYAGAKAALHLYVAESKMRTADQFLCCVSPGVIWDTHMTQQRPDLEMLEARGRATRHGRWISARECAEVARWALFDAPGFLSNTIIRMRAEQ